MGFPRLTKSPGSTENFLLDFAGFTNARGNKDFLSSGETLSTVPDDIILTSSNPQELPIEGFVLRDSNTSIQFWLSGGVLYSKYYIFVEFKTIKNGNLLDNFNKRTIQIDIRD